MKIEWEECDEYMSIGHYISSNAESSHPMEDRDFCVLYQGHLYAIFGNVESMNLEIEVRGNRVALFNLKSRTIRAISRNEMVQPVRIAIKAKVHRQWA